MIWGTFHSRNFLGCEPRSTVRLLCVLVGVDERRILTLLICLVRSACLPNGFPQPGTSQTTGTRALLCDLPSSWLSDQTLDRSPDIYWFWRGRWSVASCWAFSPDAAALPHQTCFQ